MALTLDQLKATLRVDLDEAGYDTELEALIATATAEVERYAPAAPQAVKDRAASMVAEWIHDRETGGEYRRLANALVGSGAKAMLSWWRVRLAGVVE